MQTIKDLKFYIQNYSTSDFLAAVIKQDDSRGIGHAVPEWTTDATTRLTFTSQQEAIRIASFIGPTARVKSTPAVVLIA
ncbi:hypothetical protein [Lacticaseibacillus jixiensis]|uniref:hypothetical protein n=1 Tax=Lacticaseibacillus jixiensis TaxID=3231926 RepID=UPI0036F3FD3F